jgi:hypothetical protein
MGKTNDVLSLVQPSFRLLLFSNHREKCRFYKEEKAGEGYNYIHNRGWYKNKDALVVFSEIIAEVRKSAERSKSETPNPFYYPVAQERSFLGRFGGMPFKSRQGFRERFLK